MQQWTVNDVMTPEVLTVHYDTAPADLVKTMTSYDVSALAVTDDHDSVVGVVTRTDVLRVLVVEPPRRRGRWRRAVATHSWAVRSAGQMMSAPAQTVEPDATLAEAGRLMRERAVNRLLVTGHDGRLLGVVTAADLLRVYERTDEVMRADARKAVAILGARHLELEVRDGVARLAGPVADDATATLLRRVVRDVPGVTAVRSHLTVDRPATPAASVTPPPRRPIDGWWTNRHRHRDDQPARRSG